MTAFIEALKKNPLVNRVEVEEKEITIMVAKEINLFSTLIKMAEDD